MVDNDNENHDDDHDNHDDDHDNHDDDHDYDDDHDTPFPLTLIIIGFGMIVMMLMMIVMLKCRKSVRENKSAPKQHSRWASNNPPDLRPVAHREKFALLLFASDIIILL